MKSTVAYEEIPLSVDQMARRRTHELVAFYGRFISTVSIQTLAASAYMQGIEDAMNFLDKQTEGPKQ